MSWSRACYEFVGVAFGVIYEKNNYFSQSNCLSLNYIYKMRVIFKFFLPLMLMLFSGSSVFAQQNFLILANKSFDNGAYYVAITEYKKAYTKARRESSQASIQFRIGECSRRIGEYEDAESAYQQAISKGYKDPLVYLYLADVQKHQGKVDQATSNYANYRVKKPEDKRGAIGVESTALSKEWIENPTKWQVENLEQLNTQYREFSPTYVGADSSKIYFTSTRVGVTGNETDATLGEGYSDVFEAVRDNKGGWSEPLPLDAPITTKNNEGLTSVTQNGGMLFWTRCIPQKNKVVYNTVWSIALKDDGGWGKPQKLPFNNDTNKFASPAVSPDGSMLIFASNLPGGYGENDLWMSEFDKSSQSWSEPVNLGKNINSDGNDVFPFIASNNDLYFSTNGRLGMGGLDIFKAVYSGNGKWEEAENVRYPLNSFSDDFGVIFSADMKSGLLSSNRTGTKGADDLWSFNFDDPILSITGRILASNDTTMPIPGVKVVLRGDDGSVAEAYTDEDGVFLFKLGPNGEKLVKPDVIYTITTEVGAEVTTPQYPRGFVNSPSKYVISTMGIYDARDLSVEGMNILIQPIEEEMVFPAVLYAYASAEFVEGATDSLDFLYNTLIANPTIIIELSAHTDSRGNNTYNDKLSTKRAKACVDYLVSKGIPRDRMIPKGYGKRRLKITNAEIEKAETEEEQELLHQKNRRTVFTVLKGAVYIPLPEKYRNRIK